ncbi:class I SAM-dependent methyltransferase [Sphingomonas dokdonensis]|uniref:Class I SAM-dependent methyltransferase n=1 Tax=Sphingomonas dokdonensis TaxID=344880 RepID=A0A245ZNE9_9SPHN|nr:class I SAM-dependent methyltransferase [Sphingomonas dokdonensis]OWK31278.1 hypothetical protein SPDO_12850 [Sphingomonas dokdonensis]
MRRFKVVQALLDLYESPCYLEIGVQNGITFHQTHAARKVAVDPVFRFDVDAARQQPENANSDYHQIPSDEYFCSEGANEAFDVIFLDGLHTFDQTLRDFNNALGLLKPGGVILIDDTMPSTYAASLPDQGLSARVRRATEPDNRAWMGDVFRLVYFIRDYFPQYSYATLEDNHGQTIVWKSQRISTSNPRSVEAIARLEFADMIIHRRELNIAQLADVLPELIAAQSAA